MIVLDVNLLIYAYDQPARIMHRAQVWLEEILSG